MATLVTEAAGPLATSKGVSADVFTGVFSDNNQLNFHVPTQLSIALASVKLDHLISGYVSEDNEGYYIVQNDDDGTIM